MIERSLNQFIEPMKGWRRNASARAIQLVIEGLPQPPPMQVESEGVSEISVDPGASTWLDPILDPLPAGSYREISLGPAYLIDRSWDVT